MKKLQTFHPSCLLKTSHILWSRKVSNDLLFKLTEQEDMGIVLVRIRWRWFTYALRRETINISKDAFRWTSEGKMKRGRPTTWRKTAEAELQDLNLNQRQTTRLRKDRHRWRSLVDAPCATWRLKD